MTSKLDNIPIPAIYAREDESYAFRLLVAKQFQHKYVTPDAKDELEHYVRCGRTISLTIHPSFVAARVRIIRSLHKRLGTTPIEQAGE